MNKPSNYDAVKPSGINIKPKAGYYIFEILHAEEKMSKSTAQNPSKPLLVLHLDIAEGPYKGYFMNKWRMDKKYQEKSGGNAYYRAVYRRITDHVERLKADILAIEQSNNGFKFDWDEKNLIGKKVGGALGEYEYHSYKNSCTETDIEFRPPLVPVKMVMSDDLQAPKLRKLQFKDQGSSDWNDEPLPEYKNTIVEEDLPF